MPSTARALALAGLIGALTACSSMQFRGPAERPGEDPFPAPGAEGVPRERSLENPMLDQRQACRTGAIPRGWVSVRYLQLPQDCPETRDDGGYNGVLLLYHADRAQGTELEICADQATPRGWIRDHAPARGECVGARVDKGEPTMRVIRRVR